MSDLEQFEPDLSAPIPAPKWARATAFVGLYALMLAGMVELQQSVQNLLAWAGMETGGLDRIGVLAGLYVAFMGLRPLLYLPMERNEGLYRMAWSFVTALSGLAAAIAALVAIRLAAPGFADSFIGGLAPTFATCATLALGAGVTQIATRRREAMVAAMEEMEGGEG